MISLPQMMKTIAPAIINNSKAIRIRVMILRFLDLGFFSFFIFLASFLIGVLLAVSCPLCSSKSKAWTGLRKSSVEAAGVGSGVGAGVSAVFSAGGVGITGGLSGEISATGMDFGVALTLVVLALAVRVDLAAVLREEEDLVDLGGLAVEGFFAVDDFFTEEGVAFLERRVVKPSIDLFLSIVYNYNMAGQKITKKQLALLDFLQDFTEEKGYSPSYREIQAGLGLSSVSAVAEHIDNLVARGALRKVPGAARSLEILDYKHEDAVELFKVKMMDVSEEDKKVLMKAAEILGLDLE